MPRYAHSQLRWSEQKHTYILSIGDQVSEQTLTSEWLEQVASFSFHSRSGMYYTVRKQKVQRGSSYWYGYRRLHGQIVKRYLGKTTDLTLARLEEIAHLMESPSGSRHLSLQSHREATLPQPSPHVAPPSDGERSSPVGALTLLFSKLSPPRLHTSLLDRSRLFALLDAGREGHLTLLSAPAGFGKTTLVSQWIAARRASPDFPPVAWVSLETADNDPVRFWRYLIAACQKFQTDLAQVHNALASTTPQPPFVPSSLETMLTTLLNALAQCPSGGVLVLEDYHAITSQEIHETISFFLDHLPATIHLIMITRSDPPFSLTRLRARNDLSEIRTADLRFSQEETATLLQQALPSPLAAETIQQLHAQLEGWGAGLHLMKLALQRTGTQTNGAQIPPHLLKGNAPFREYFVAEVLDLQPEPVQQFLLQTSLLTRLTASLCDAVTEQYNSQDMLTLLERTNAFLEPLDTTTLALSGYPQSSQQWFRYHALFAEAMRDEARRRFRENELRDLSDRASRWYEEHGLLNEAIDAALFAQDYTRAAILIEQSLEEYSMPGEIQEPHTFHRWLEQFPESILGQNPTLALSYATTVLFQSSSWLPDASTLRTLERLLRSAEHCFRVENQFPRLGELFAFRALLALRQRDSRTAMIHAKQALEWLPQTLSLARRTQQIWRGLCLSIVADEWIEMGHFQQARTALLESHTLCEAAENHYFKRVAMTRLAQICFEQGEIQQATSLYHQVLAETREDKYKYAFCNALIGLAALLYECNELEIAYQHVQEAIAVSQSYHLIYLEVQATIILARVQQARGEHSVAHKLLADLLDRMPISLPLLSQEIQTAQARLALAVGDSITIQRWVTGRQPQHDFSQEIGEELLISRWLRIQGKLEEASQQLERLLAIIRKAEHTRRIREIRVEMVLVAVARKRKEEAQQLLREVLVQAFASNAIRPFLDAGEQMAILLHSLLPQLRDQSLLTYIRTLLSMFPVQQQKEAQAALVEPLSPQEMRVLRLLVQHRSNADIASELVVSVNTVRTQVQSIYSKLGVHSRNAASDVARELQLL